MTEEKANRNEACSFVLITERLDKLDHMLDFALYVVKDFPNPDPLLMTADGHAHMLEVRQHQLSQTLTHAGFLLSRIVTEYERLVRVKFVGLQDGKPDINIYVCGECIDCGVEEPGDRLACNPYACPLRSYESYKGIRKRVENAIEGLSQHLNMAQDLGCEEPALWYGTLRSIITKWGREGYHHYLKEPSPETGTKD